MLFFPLLTSSFHLQLAFGIRMSHSFWDCACLLSFTHQPCLLSCNTYKAVWTSQGVCFSRSPMDCCIIWSASLLSEAIVVARSDTHPKRATHVIRFSKGHHPVCFLRPTMPWHRMRTLRSLYTQGQDVTWLSGFAVKCLSLMPYTWFCRKVVYPVVWSSKME